MPVLDGYGVLERIRKNPETATTSFIFLTAFTEKANMRQGMEKGADDFLVKPYTRDELIAAINAQWKKHSLIEKQVQEKVDELGRNVTYALPHEFRTVLNQVVGSAKYMYDHPEKVAPDEIKELSEDIISSSERLLKITENFLIYARIESFSANPEKRRQLRSNRTEEPAAIINDVADTLADKYSRKYDISFESYVEQISLEISSESFHKIIIELIDNAFKFSEKSQPIKINMWTDNRFLFVSISDEGRGMSAEQISKVGAYIQFERTMYEQQGVGLGLVISKRLVELHDGTFEIASEETKGTIIKFSLPMCLEVYSRESLIQIFQ